MEEISEIAAKAKECLLPTKSRPLYEEAYACYKKWCLKNKVMQTTEDTILAYFNTELVSYKASSLWTKYSMLRTTVNLKEGIDISKFGSIIPFLKRRGEGYKAKKSLILSKENVESFLLHAEEEQHLLNKVILIFGVSGACRRQELVSLTTTNVEDHEKHILVKLIDTKTRKDRSFVILSTESFNSLQVIRKYINLPPKTTPHNRFFVNYVKGKCTVEPVGIHKIGGVPRVVARFLNLADCDCYTGHCFRRTSASLLANAGGSMDDILRHGGWRSTSVAEGYVEQSERKKIETAVKILGQESTSGIESEKIEDVKNEPAESLSISGNVNCVINITYNSST